MNGDQGCQASKMTKKHLQSSPYSLCIIFQFFWSHPIDFFMKRPKFRSLSTDNLYHWFQISFIFTSIQIWLKCVTPDVIDFLVLMESRKPFTFIVWQRSVWTYCLTFYLAFDGKKKIERGRSMLLIVLYCSPSASWCLPAGKLPFSKNVFDILFPQCY